jgi:Tol biopolymer transport system component
MSRLQPLILILLAAAGLSQAQEQEQEKILYIAKQANGKMNVCVMNNDGSRKTNLTKSDLQEMDPAWSPDRKKIVFMVIDDDEQQVDLFVMNADGTKRTRLTKLADKTFPHSPCWSPKSGQILFTVGTEPGPKGFRREDLWVVDADGKKLTKLGKGNDPSWSPDGKTILFSAPDAENKESRLFLMDAKGQKVRALTKEVGEMGKWSPDGKRIVYSGKIGEEAGIIVMNADGTGAKVVYQTPNVLFGFGAQWSADGKRIYFNATTNLSPPCTAIFVINADGSGKKELTSPSTQSCLGNGSMRLLIIGSSGIPEQIVRPVKTWSGKVADKALENKKPANGILVNARSFAELWEAWRDPEKLPKVDFKKNLVVVVTGKNIIPEIQYGIDGKGALLEMTRAEAVGEKIEGFAYFIAVLPRAGIKSFKGQKIPSK